MEPMTNPWGQCIRGLTLVLVAALVLAGCASNPKPPSTLNLPSAGAGQNGNNQGNPMPGRRDIDVRGLKGIDPSDRSLFTDPNNPLSTRIIYFPLDSSAIPSRFSAAIAAHAKYLAAHPGVHLRLEGNTDERGTREYNIALGERRAEAVKQALAVSGASPGQITTLSFGEERPAVLGHTDAAYAKNRRVEFIYTK